MSHTPGPWTAQQVNDYDWEVIIPDGDDDPWNIALVFDAAKEGSAEDNARLIAAAPDLLESARRALIELRQWAPVHAQAEIVGLETAIAKATGASQ